MLLIFIILESFYCIEHVLSQDKYPSIIINYILSIINSHIKLIHHMKVDPYINIIISFNKKILNKKIKKKHDVKNKISNVDSRLL